MSIKNKLFASFSIIILILIGLSVYSSIQIYNINKDYSFLIEDRVYKVVEAGKIQNSSSLQGLYLRSYVLRQSEEDIENLFEQRKIVSETLKEIEHLFLSSSMQEQILTLKEQQELYNGVCQHSCRINYFSILKDSSNLKFNQATALRLLAC